MTDAPRSPVTEPGKDTENDPATEDAEQTIRHALAHVPPVPTGIVITGGHAAVSPHPSVLAALAALTRLQNDREALHDGWLYWRDERALPAEARCVRLTQALTEVASDDDCATRNPKESLAYQLARELRACQAVARAALAAVRDTTPTAEDQGQAVRDAHARGVVSTSAESESQSLSPSSDDDAPSSAVSAVAVRGVSADRPDKTTTEGAE